MTTGEGEQLFLDRARALAQAEEWDELSQACQEFLATTPSAPVAYLLGCVYLQRNRISDAAIQASLALDIGPGRAEYADLLAVAHAYAGDLTNGIFNAKLALTMPEDDTGLTALLPPDMPSFASVLASMEENRLFNRAKQALAAGRYDVAEDFLLQHLHFFPEDEDAMLLEAVIQSSNANHTASGEWLRGCLHRLPRSPRLVSALATELAEQGAFEHARETHARAARLAPDDCVMVARAVLDLVDDPMASQPFLAGLSGNWAARFATHDAPPAEPRPAGKPMTVGVFLSDLVGQPQGSFLAQLLGHSNPTEIRLVGYGYGQLTSPLLMEFQQAFRDWYDLTDLDVDTIGDMLVSEDLDLVLDSAGFTSPFTLAALGRRCAQRQVLWRNVPSAAGFDNIDAVLSDRFLGAEQAPADGVRRLVLEHGAALAELPTAELPLVPVVERPAPVFGADVGLRHITPETANWWGELLLAFPDSMLVLRDNNLTKPKSVEKLVQVFGTVGVSHRIDIISDTEEGFWANADVALMPLRAENCQKAVHALWLGVPTLAPAMAEPHARTTASLLAHAGLDSLVPRSIDEFIDAARRWTDAGERRRFQAGIREALSSSPVFSPKARAEDLWRTCRQLFD